MKYLISLIFILSVFFASAQDKTVTFYQDGAATPPDLVVTLKHLTANVSFKPEENLVYGDVEFTFIPNRYRTDSVVFYAPDFVIKEVRSSQFVAGSQVSRETRHASRVSRLASRVTSESSKALIWKYTSPNLVIYFSSSLLEYHKEYKLNIKYEARPMAGAIYFIGWRPEEEGKRKEIWAHRPHGWIPYMDARITVDMFVRFDEKYKVFSNGERMEVNKNTDGTKTWHYRMAKDHPFFSTALVIGDYDYKTSQSKGGVPMEFWYYHGQEDKVQPTFQYSEAMMDFLEKELGFKYPYPLYRQAPVIDYMYGAMETTTSTVFGDYMMIDPHAFWQRNYINTNAHELTHQWFGNCIAHLVNKDVWLTESFATYYAKMFEKATFGEDHYRNIMNDEYNLVMNAAKKNNYPVNSSMGGVERIYQKGSMVLGMLKYVMGDREFHDAMNLYLERYKFRYAETNDFIRCMYDVTGKPYNWFFDEWVLHGGEPNYKVTYQIEDDTLGNRSTVIKVYQVHETNDLIGLFKMPIIFEVFYKDGSMDSVKSWIDGKYNEVVIPDRNKKSIDFVVFDPNREILKKVTFDRTFEELTAQALRGRNMIDRYDALVAMHGTPLDKKRNILISCYQKESFFLTKSEIIDQLSADTSKESIELFRKALNDPDANVRKEALKNLFPVPPILKEEVEKCLDDFSYLNTELALQNLCQSFPAKTDRYLELTKKMTGWRGFNIRMKWLEIAISSGKKDYLQELISYTGPKFEFETRMNSLNVLKRLRYTDETILRNATSASKHWNNKLAAVGKDYLSYFGK
jgi:aminopeptidase N